MLDFRFLLGISVICSHGVVFFGGGETGLRACNFLHPVALFLEDFLLLQSLKHVARIKAICETIDVFLPKSLSPDNLTVILQSPPFLGNSLDSEAEGRGLLFVFPFRDFLSL